MVIVAEGDRVKPTEEHGEEVVLVEQFVQHFAVHVLDLVLDLKHVLRGQPDEDLVRLVQVTVVQQRSLLAAGEGKGFRINLHLQNRSPKVSCIPEVDQRRYINNFVFLHRSIAGNLHKVNAKQVCFAINLLEDLQNILAIIAFLVVWKRFENQ